MDPSEFGVRSSANSIILFSHLVCSMILFNYKGRGRATRIHGGGLSIAPSAVRRPSPPLLVLSFKLTVTVTTILYGGVIMCSDERSGARAAFAGDMRTARAHETSRLTCTPAHNSPLGALTVTHVWGPTKEKGRSEEDPPASPHAPAGPLDRQGYWGD